MINPTPLVKVTTTNESCAGSSDGSAFATVSSGTAPFTYSWSTNPVQTTINATGLTAGSYTLTVTDANGCTATVPFVIIAPPIPPAPVVSPAKTLSMCDLQNNLATYAITNYNPLYTYSVNVSPAIPPGNIVVSSLNVNGICQITFPPATTFCGPYTVTFSSASSLAAGQIPACLASTDVYVVSCCPCTATPPSSPDVYTTSQSDNSVTLVANDPQYAGLFTNNGGVYTYYNPGHVWYLNDQFFIDAPLIIASSEVQLNGGAQILATQPGPGLKLTITTRSLLHAGCDFMWDGIYVSGNNSVVVDDNSTIEDAQNAIVSIGGAKFTCDLAIFNKNYKSIVVNPFAGNHPGTIKATILTCRNIPQTTAALDVIHLRGPVQPGPLYNFSVLNSYPTATLLPPRTGQRSYQGMDLNQQGTTTLNIFNAPIINAYTEIDIGTAVGQWTSLNIFDNMDYGIYSLNSDATIRNNVFQNMTGPTHFFPPSANFGVGVYGLVNDATKSLRMVIGGSGDPWEINHFMDCNRGIDMNAYYDLTILNNEFYSTQAYSPIPLPGPRPTGNYAAFIKSGSYININVQNNDIINWNQGINFVNDALLVSAHQLRKLRGDARFNNNNIAANFSSPPTSQFVQNAIVVQSILPACTGCTLTVINAYDKMRINYNTITDVFNGITIQNWDDHAESYTNTIGMLQQPVIVNPGPNQNGIQINNCINADIYDNSINANTTSKLNLRGIFATLNVNPMVRCNSISTVGQDLVFQGANVGTVRYNRLGASQDGFVLTNNGLIGMQGNPSPNATSSDNIWAGPFSTSDTHTFGASTYASNSPLYVRNNFGPNYNPLTAPPALNLTTGGIPTINDYLAPGAITSITTTSSINHCNNPPPFIAPNNSGPGLMNLLERIVQDSLQIQAYVLQTKWLNKQQVFKLLQQNPPLLASPVLQAFYTLEQTGGIYGTVSTVKDSIAIGSFTAALSSNATIAPVNLIESNQQTVNAIYLGLLQGNPIDQLQTQTLESIAQQCPLTGGTAVYEARTLLTLVYDDYKVFTDNCIPESRSMIIVDTNNSDPAPVNDVKNFRLYPNPNDGSMTLEYMLEDNQTGYFTIMDLTGRKIVERKLIPAENKLTINEQELANGIYFYNVVIDNKINAQNKLIIAK